MFYRGTGKTEHGFRVSVIMDAGSRFILGYSLGTYHKEKPKKGEEYSELEKAAIAMAEKNLKSMVYSMNKVQFRRLSIPVKANLFRHSLEQWLLRVC